MPIALDYPSCRGLLDRRFAAVVTDAARGRELAVPAEVERLFESPTQAYREVLLGVVLARWADRRIDITKPYAKQGADAFNGRSLDEEVVNPFLHDNRIPSSRGPFLGVFRRSVRYTPATREGLRDKEGYDALLRLIERLQAMEDEAEIVDLLDRVLGRFYALREEAQVSISRLQRISLEQAKALTTGLLAVPSGGRFPVMVVEATLTAINQRFELGWMIEVQGINVADAVGHAGGDIQVSLDGETVFAAEVTERPIGVDRVVATFQAKVAPNAIGDYLFLTTDGVDDQAKAQARAYFALGHEVNFINIADWVGHTLASLGPEGRMAFFGTMVELLDRDQTPVALKTAWNSEIDNLARVR